MTTVAKLSDGRLDDERRGWIVTIVITAMAFGLRFYNFWFPGYIVFDETYYPKDAWALLASGYERAWPDRLVADPLIAAGDPSSMLDTPAFIAHPPLGKWLIALGEDWFGMNSFGWRFMSVVFGALLVLLTIRLARRLSRSTLVGAIAGLLITFDGLAFVMSRVGLLDIFQATLTLAGVACLVVDRDWLRGKLADYLTSSGLQDLGGAFGPKIWWRPWRLLAGIMFGAACAVKWNTLFVVAVFGIVTVIWDISARRLAGASKTSLKSLYLEAPLAFVSLVVVGALVYLSTWYGWLTTQGGWGRQWGVENPDNPLVKIIGAPLASLWHYHVEMYHFHTVSMVGSEHPYSSNPMSWLFMVRPLAMDAVNDIQPGVDGCPAIDGTCLRVINAMGTPVLWWLAAIALFVGLFYWLSGRDYRFGVPVLATFAVWLPWFMYTERTIFFFYAVVMVPFTVTGLALWLGKILGPADGPQRPRRAMLVGVLIFLVIANFAFLYPVLTDQLMTRAAWLMRMWFPSWI